MRGFKVSRASITILFVIFVVVAFWRASSEVNIEEDRDLKRYNMARGPLREVLQKSGYLFSSLEQRVLSDGIQRLTQVLSTQTFTGKSDLASAGAIRNSCQAAMWSVLAVFDSSAAVKRLWTNGGETILQYPIRKQWPSGKGMLMLRVSQPGSETDTVPEFIYADRDLAEGYPSQVRLGSTRTSYVFLFFENAKPGTSLVSVTFVVGRTEIAKLALAIEVPPAGNLTVTVVDGETGKPTPAVVGLYAADHQLVVPPQAISFDDAGFAYRRGQVRPYQSCHYWPGNSDERQVFFVDGSFSLALPASRYKLIIGKGFEYVPVAQSIELQPANNLTRTITVKRWINMPARGWYSGDGHVHYARLNEKANRRLMTWARAEDVHMINVMRMGDALKTYFEQYAFGKTGRKISLDYALVPGQEDPRTNYIGHTLQMNIQHPVHYQDEYYLYDSVFDEIHAQGGLTGYAHVYFPPKGWFGVGADMTMNIPKHKVDFAEICEIGNIETDLYYEFLNLGFKLTATAGSDVPWENTIGTSRVYAYTGTQFDADAWFKAVKNGHTFVTTGPMLELTVNDQIPGAEIYAKLGETLHIKARASGYNVPPNYLEVVAQGEIVKSAQQITAHPEKISLEFTLPVRHSTWIAARCAGAHTSPVYVMVADQPFWKVKAVPELVETRLRQLDDIAELTKRGVNPGSEPNWDNPGGFQKNIPQLLQRVEAARTIYRDMLRRVKLQLEQNSNNRPGSR